MKRRIFAKIIISIGVLCFAALFANAQKSEPTISAKTLPIISAKAIQKRQQAFEKVWSIVNEKHFDATFGGVDWRKIRTIYEPKAMSAKSDDEFHGVLQAMLNELGQSHFAIITPKAELVTARKEREKAEKQKARPEKVEIEEQKKEPEVENPEENTTPEDFEEPEKGVTGLTLKIIENKAVISRVEADSPAAKAGLKTGFIIEKINAFPVATLLERVDAILANRRETAGGKQFMREQTLRYWLAGEPNSKIALEVLNEKNEPQKIELIRVLEKREYSLPLGNLPRQPVEFEARRLENKIGYIRFNSWAMPQLSKIRVALKEMSDAPGIIFDIRGNTGGIGLLAAGIAGNLLNEQISLGVFKSRGSEQKIIAYPQLNAYRGKVVILTDGGSASTSEIFAAGLQEQGRAKVIGETTMGAVLASIFDKLPTGAIFQYAVSGYLTPKNVLIEGRGVKPDAEVKLTRESLLAGRDLQIEAAASEILKQTSTQPEK